MDREVAVVALPEVDMEHLRTFLVDSTTDLLATTLKDLSRLTGLHQPGLRQVEDAVDTSKAIQARQHQPEPRAALRTGREIWDTAR